MKPAPAIEAFPGWDRAELPAPPVFRLRNWTLLIGPGLLMAGSNIGGGEWLFGPLVTAQYGGRMMWLATLSILLQVFYNLAVMRYALYCGESIFVGFFRTPPGPRFWTVFYLLTDFGALWPFVSANAAVALAAAILGRLPSAGDDTLVRSLGYAVFAAAAVPLVFGGKIYNAVERLMITKLVLVLSYLGFIGVFWVSWDTWREIVSGLVRFGSMPDGDFNWATLAAFAASAGAGGLTNSTFSSYARDKGWGMGAPVGSLPSAVGGRTIRLSHSGKVFDITPATLARWRGWLRHIRRDQLALWAPGCIVGMVLPSLVSYHYLRGVQVVDGNSAAAMAAQAIANEHGRVFWFLTLLCGFLILAPGQVSHFDTICRRWTDVIWMGVRRLRRVDENKVKHIYYGILTAYGLWGFLALRLTPNPLVLAIASGVMLNFAFGFSALHTLYVNVRLLPEPLRPGWPIRLGLMGGAVFYIGISGIALRQQWPNVARWLGW